MKHLILLILFSLTSPVFSQEFKAWYFEFFTHPVIISGELDSPNEVEKLAFTGTRTGKLSADKKSFIETSDYIYQPNTKHRVSIKWMKTEVENTFTGEAKDTEGKIITYLLQIKNQTEFTFKSKNTRGWTAVQNGKLKADGKVYIDGIVHSEDGDVMFTANYILSKKNEKATEPE